MFKLSGGSVHYGAGRSCPLNGLEEKYGTIEGVDDQKLSDLTRDVGLITGFPREFEIKHCEEIDVDKLSADNGDLRTSGTIIPERIVAIANGYTITWKKEI